MIYTSVLSPLASFSRLAHYIPIMFVHVIPGTWHHIIIIIYFAAEIEGDANQAFRSVRVLFFFHGRGAVGCGPHSSLPHGDFSSAREESTKNKTQKLVGFVH